MRLESSKSCSISVRVQSVIWRKSRFAKSSPPDPLSRRRGGTSVKMTGLCDGFYPGLPGETRLRALQDVPAEVLVFDNAKQSLPHRGSVEHDVFARIIG